MRALSKLGWRTLQGESIFEVIKGSHVKNFFAAIRLNMSESSKQQQQQQQQQQQHTFSSTTHNKIQMNTLRVFNLNTWMSFFVGGPNRRERMNRMLRFLNEEKNQFDVLTFQEMFTFAMQKTRILRADLNYVVDGLRDVGYVHDTGDLMVRNTPAIGQNAGLLVMSRVPIENAKLVTFDSRRKFSAKGVLRCELENHWVIYNTHLEHKKTTLQRKQIETISNLIEDTNSKKTTSVLLGDFNLCPREKPEMYTFLRDSMSANGTRIVRNLSENLPWTCDLRMAKDPEDTELFLTDHTERNVRVQQEWGVTIDHCWVVGASGSAKCNAVSLQASDHLGLAIEINREKSSTQ